MSDVALPEVLTEEDDEAGDELVRMSTGRVRIVIAGEPTITLRRPLLGEFRTIRERLNEEATEGQRIRKELREQAEQEQANGNGAAIRIDYDPTVEMENWIRHVIGVLGDAPSDTDLPFWATSAELAPLLIEHWQKVPLGRGSRSNKPA